MKATCSIDNCGGISYGKGLCQKHYRRFQLYGNTHTVNKPGPKPGCNNIITHGKSNARIYTIWKAMRSRCTNLNDRRYPDYGGRGITLCERWKDFTNFNKDMSPSYADNLTIDRIDNNQGYSKENCKWSSYKEQCNNKRNNRVIVYKGKAFTLTQLAEEVNIDRACLGDRLTKHKWTLEEAVLIPVIEGKRMRAKERQEFIKRMR